MWLEDLKRRVYLVALPLIAFAAAIGFVLNRPRTELALFNRILGPFAIVFSLTLTFVLWRRLVGLRRFEIVTYAGLAAFMLARLALALFAVDAQNPLGFTFSAFSPWIGAVLLLAFVMFETRIALRATGALYLAMLVLVAGYVVRKGLAGASRFEINALVQQFVVANAFYIVLLVVLSRAKEAYGRSEYESQVLSRLAHTDELTGVPNRRHLVNAGEKELERLRRNQRPFSVVLIDIDHFKRVNDDHGHAAGDAVLKELTRVMGENLRSGDELGRFGGEEFIVLAYDAGSDVAHTLAERLRTAIEQHRADGVPHATASFGVASYKPGDSFDSLVARADRALYDAKAAGRNRVAVAA